MVLELRERLESLGLAIDRYAEISLNTNDEKLVEQLIIDYFTPDKWERTINLIFKYQFLRKKPFFSFQRGQIMTLGISVQPLGIEVRASCKWRSGGININFHGNPNRQELDELKSYLEQHVSVEYYKIVY